MASQNHIIFSGLMETAYSQLYILSGDYNPSLMSYDAFTGQFNGICGGVGPGGLYLWLGVHTGRFHITVEVHEVAPAIDTSWEEIVEASCSFNAPPISLQGWAGESILELPLSAGNYRVRFCAKGYGVSEEQRKFGDPSIESYCLILWSEPRRCDEVIKQTNANAIFKHQKVQQGS